jgi:hypothetical protein
MIAGRVNRDPAEDATNEAKEADPNALSEMIGSDRAKIAQDVNAQLTTGPVTIAIVGRTALVQTALVQTAQLVTNRRIELAQRVDLVQVSPMTSIHPLIHRATSRTCVQRSI